MPPLVVWSISLVKHPDLMGKHHILLFSSQRKYETPEILIYIFAAPFLYCSINNAVTTGLLIIKCRFTHKEVQRGAQFGSGTYPSSTRLLSRVLNLHKCSNFVGDLFTYIERVDIQLCNNSFRLVYKKSGSEFP